MYMQIKYVGNEPQHMTLGAAGGDLISTQDYLLHPNEQVMIETGTAVGILDGYFGMVCPRSSLCNKQGLHMVNSVGIIDSDYTGTIKVVYKNTSNNIVTISQGERIAQLIIMPHVTPSYVEVDSLDSTERGEGGFGSTGFGVQAKFKLI